MTSESDKGSEGRGLPVGWGWRGDEDGFAFRLYPPGCGSLDYSAAAYRDGSFVAYREASGSEEIANEDRDEPRTPETMAAAQAAAEAALWSRDGYGTGEVRGVRLPLLDISDAAALVASRQTVTLPGLSGWWIVRAARCDGEAEGVEVDAVRAPVEPAPVIEAGPFCEWALCRAPLSGPARPGCGSPYMHKGEPAPREPSALALPCQGCGDPIPEGAPFSERVDDGCPFCPRCAAENAGGDDPDEMRRGTWPGAEPSASTFDATAEIITDPTAIDCGCSGGCGRMPDEMVFTGKVGSALLCIHCYTRAVREDERRRAVKAEPPAPTDGAELARLLPGLLDYCAAVLAEPDEDTRSRLGVGKRLALACSLLLGERERVAATLQALFSDVATPIELATHTTELLEEAARETDKLRARVAELEAAAARSREQDRTILAGLRALEEQIEPLSLDGETAEATLARVLAAPHPAVAGLLAEMQEARESGEDCGMREAIEMVREHLGGPPSPLARVAAEVMALVPADQPDANMHPRDYLEEIAEVAQAQDGEHRENLRNVAALGLAGMLACDAAPVPTGEEQSK